MKQNIQENPLKSLINLHPLAWEDPTRFRDLIKEYFPDDKIKMNLLIISAEEKIPADIYQKESIDNKTVSDLSKRICDSCGCNAKLAKEVIKLWIDALDIRIEKKSPNINTTKLDYYMNVYNKYDSFLPKPKLDYEAYLMLMQSVFGAKKYYSKEEIKQNSNYAQELMKKVEEALNTLTDKEKCILKSYYGIGEEKKANKTIADIWGVSYSRVSQIKANALRRLRHPSRSRILKEYLEHETLSSKMIRVSISKQLIQSVEKQGLPLSVNSLDIIRDEVSPEEQREITYVERVFKAERIRDKRY